MLAEEKGHDVFSIDVHFWGFNPCHLENFLLMKPCDFENYSDFTVFMNPPFSKACLFVYKAKEIGAKKIICFQRFAWYEGSKNTGKKRGQWWLDNPPSRVYVCGDRAHSWRHDIPMDKRGSSSPTAHAWFVWEKGAPAGTLLGHIWKDDANV